MSFLWMCCYEGRKPLPRQSYSEPLTPRTLYFFDKEEQDDSSVYVNLSEEEKHKGPSRQRMETTVVSP